MLSSRDLTTAERLRIERRRSSTTQAQAAHERGVSLVDYKAAESGTKSNLKVAVGRLAPHEICFILRRRSGWTLDELSARVDLTKHWLCQIERGRAPHSSLFHFWEQQSA